MPETRTGLRPGPSPRSVRDADGAVHPVPAGWELLPPGDAGVTRAVKALGPSWGVEEVRGRKHFSRGIWAPAEHITRARESTETQRADPAYQRRLEAGRQRRAEEQAAYVEEFEAAVLTFLRFHARYDAMARDLAARVAAHATPVGSGTVARTERIPVEKRAESAVIAWMRHQTTTYDDMSIVRIKGARREVRRELAEGSRRVLQRYRRGEDIAPGCPLAAALAREVVPAVPAAPARVPEAPVRGMPGSPTRGIAPAGSAASREGTGMTTGDRPHAPDARSATTAAGTQFATPAPNRGAMPGNAPVAVRSAATRGAPAAVSRPIADEHATHARAPGTSSTAPPQADAGAAGSPRTHRTPPRAPSPPRPPSDPARSRLSRPTEPHDEPPGRSPLPPPRDATEEARRALYERVRARLTRGRTREPE